MDQNGIIVRTAAVQYGLEYAKLIQSGSADNHVPPIHVVINAAKVIENYLVQGSTQPIVNVDIWGDDSNPS